MTPRAAPPRRALWTLLRMGGRRWVNRLGSFWSRRRRKADGRRGPTPGKRRAGLLWSLFAGLFMIWIVVQHSLVFLSLTAQAVAGLERSEAAARGDRDPPIIVKRHVFREIQRAEQLGDREIVARLLHPPEDDAQAQARAQARSQSPGYVYHFNDTKSFVAGQLYHEAREKGLAGADADEQVRQWLERFVAEGADAFASDKAHMAAERMFSGPHWPAAQGRPLAVRTVCVMLMLITLWLVVMPLGGQEKGLEAVQPTLEWLFTMPVRARTVLLTQLLREAVFNVPVWLFVLPALTIAVWVSVGPWYVPLALPATVALALLTASISHVLMVWFRMKLTASGVQSAQGAATVLQVGMLLPMAMLVFRGPPQWLLKVVAWPSAAVFWNPLMLAGRLTVGGAEAIAATVVLLALAVLSPAIAVTLTERLLARGVVTGAGPVRRARTSAAQRRSRFRGIVARELLLLVRRRWLLAQILIVPVMVIGFQIAIQGADFADLLVGPRSGPLLAYGMAAYMLLTPCLRCVAFEGRAFWMLYTLPRPIEKIMAAKAKVWAGVGLCYAAIILAAGWIANPSVSVDRVVTTVLALAGVPIVAFTNMALGVLSANPLADDPRRQVRAGGAYAAMILAGMYLWAIYSPDRFVSLSVMVQMALIAYALWQSVADGAPYMLDPELRPPPRVRLADGLIAVLALLVLQGAITLAATAPGDEAVTPVVLIISYGVSGAVTLAVTLTILGLRRVPDLLRGLGLTWRSKGPSLVRLLESLGLGLALGVIVVIYQFLIMRFAPDLGQSLSTGMKGSGAPWLVVLLVAVAPLVEETLFRGLLYTAMRRTWRPALSMALSAVLFAMIHPAVSAPPVLLLGLAAAWMFQRSGRLLEPILIHAVYNAAVVAGLLMLG